MKCKRCGTEGDFVWDNDYFKNTNRWRLLEVGLTSAQPKNFLRKFINKNSIILEKNRIALSNYGKIFVIAYGKAGDSMAKYASERINISKITLV